MPSFFIYTFGCKVNQAESGSMAKLLKDAGWAISPDATHADCVIINTCTVTSRANMQSRNAIRQALRANPAAVIAVTGCYAQTTPNELAAIPGIDYLFGNNRKNNLCDTLIAHGVKKPLNTVVLVDDIAQDQKFIELPYYDLENRTRPFLKIQDGCDAFCTYCAVPLARGRSRSMLPSAVIAHINQLYADGFKEVVLTGIHVGRYGQDFTPQTNLVALLQQVLTKTHIPRIRISSIESVEVTDELLQLAKTHTHRICPHWHLPLQSGDDEVLQRMGRHYTRADYRNTLEKIRTAFPNAAIGCDVLAGFPSETEANFTNTYKLIENMPVTYLHVFPYSVRPNTKAAGMPNKVPANIAKARCQALRKLGQTKKLAFYQAQVGQTVQVLVESYENSLCKGFSDNYLPLTFAGNQSLKNNLVNVKIEKLNNHELFGTII